MCVDLNAKAIPLMHTWRYQHPTHSNTTAHKHAFDTFQVPTGYKWDMDFTKDCLDAVLGIIAKLGNFKMVHGWETLATRSPGGRGI